MNDDIRTRLDESLPHGRVPFDFDTDAAVMVGRRARNRRRFAIGGSATLSVVAISAVLVAGLMPEQPHGSPPGYHGEPDTSGPVKIDPDLDYIWVPTARNVTNDATKEYTAAF
jgi:hypothetical protein